MPDAQRAGGVGLIAAERQRQIEQEGWTPEHDDRHTLGELAAAGACYALLTTRWKDARALVGGSLVRDILWPWEREWFKPADYPKPPYHANVHRDKDIKDLVRAGALIAAEIDRLQRQRQARDDRPVHRPAAPDAPIPGHHHHYGGCDPDHPRVNPNGICEGCGGYGCPHCGKEGCSGGAGCEAT